MNSLQQLNYYAQNSGIVFTDDRPYNINFTGTTTAESIAADEDILFPLDPLNDLIFDEMSSIDNDNENHVTLEIDLSNNENMSELANRYEVNFATAPRNVQYFKYEKTTTGVVEDYQSIGSSNNRANVWTARYIQTNNDFKTVYDSVSIRLIDRTSPIAITARLMYPIVGHTPVDITNNSVGIDNDTSTVNDDSMEFSTSYDASSPGRTLVTDTTLIPASADFTVEMYVYSSLFSDTSVQHIFAQGGATGTRLRKNSDGTLTFFVSNSEGVSSTGAISDSTWTHIAVVNSNSNLRLFVDGVLQNSITKTNSVNQTSNTVFGAASELDLDNFVGLMEEIRVSKVARYSANFTPATTPHTPDINTSLLLHPTVRPPYRGYFESDYPFETVEKSFNVTLTGSDEVEGFGITRSYNYGQTVFLFREGYPTVIDAATEQTYDAFLSTTTGGILSVYGNTGSVVSITGATRDEVNQFYRDVQYISPGTEPYGDTITWSLRNSTDAPDEYTSAAGSFSMTANFP